MAKICWMAHSNITINTLGFKMGQSYKEEAMCGMSEIKLAFHSGWGTLRNFSVEVKWSSSQEEHPRALKAPRKSIFQWGKRQWRAGSRRPGGQDGPCHGAGRVWELATAWLDVSDHRLLVQFDTVAIALLVRQPFVVSQDVLHQEARRLIHVDVVLEWTKLSVRTVMSHLTGNSHFSCFGLPF